MVCPCLACHCFVVLFCFVDLFSFSGVPGKKCGTIILSAEELSNCRVSNRAYFSVDLEGARLDQAPPDLAGMRL